jgi:Tc toxin complex TcA C-terminal TcB-binding domain
MVQPVPIQRGLVQQIDHSMEVENFLRDKFTSHALYLFLQQETAALYRQAYDLALQSALELQEAFRFEREGYAMEAGRNFIPHHGWNSLPEGLMAGEGLSIALRRMERAFMKTDMREYELTKHFSLALHFPVAFLQLKATGRCEIDIPEWMFDMGLPRPLPSADQERDADDSVYCRAILGRALSNDDAEQPHAHRSAAAGGEQTVLQR